MTILIKQSDIRAVLMDKLCGEGGFIRVPEGAEYSAEDAINVLLHAATSSSNPIESEVQDLQAMHPISRIPCADTVHTSTCSISCGKSALLNLWRWLPISIL
ncbi:MAG: hypothetical protein U9Q37_05740 [Euryarchaeota archaeon]|nr:hypothetical protein [Euryarchaeota archaeon]